MASTRAARHSATACGASQAGKSNDYGGASWIPVALARARFLLQIQRPLDPSRTPSASPSACNILSGLADATRSPTTAGLRAQTSALRRVGRDPKFSLLAPSSPDLRTAPPWCGFRKPLISCLLPHLRFRTFERSGGEPGELRNQHPAHDWEHASSSKKIPILSSGRTCSSYPEQTPYAQHEKPRCNDRPVPAKEKDPRRASADGGLVFQAVRI
jgi:hypothetical protein